MSVHRGTDLGVTPDDRQVVTLRLSLEARTVMDLRKKLLRVSGLLHEMARGKRPIPEIGDDLRAAGADVVADPRGVARG